MKKIELSDIIDIAEYERKRKEYRSKIMQEKDKRRIYVGPQVTYLFETLDTMLYQVQEMMRAERIVEEEGIMAEINAYNELIPEKNQLSASMFIEISDARERKELLSKLIDLPKHTFLHIDGDKIYAEFDPRQGSEDKLSSVQYVKFNLNNEQVSRFNSTDSKISLGFDHLYYNHQYELTADQKKTMFVDMQ